MILDGDPKPVQHALGLPRTHVPPGGFAEISVCSPVWFQLEQINFAKRSLPLDLVSIQIRYEYGPRSGTIGDDYILGGHVALEILDEVAGPMRFYEIRMPPGENLFLVFHNPTSEPIEIVGALFGTTTYEHERVLHLQHGVDARRRLSGLLIEASPTSGDVLQLSVRRDGHDMMLVEHPIRFRSGTIVDGAVDAAESILNAAAQHVSERKGAPTFVVKGAGRDIVFTVGLEEKPT